MYFIIFYFIGKESQDKVWDCCILEKLENKNWIKSIQIHDSNSLLSLMPELGNSEEKALLHYMADGKTKYNKAIERAQYNNNKLCKLM